MAYTLRFYIPSDASKELIEAATGFSSHRQVTDKDGNSYDLIDVIGWKSKADSAEEFSDWTETNTSGVVTYAQAATANPRTAVLYIREEFRDKFRFSQDILPLYVYYTVTTGSRSAVDNIIGSADDRWYYWNNVDSSETAYLQGVLQDNGYEYYFHFEYDYSHYSSSSTIYLYLIFARYENYFEQSGASYNVQIGNSNYAYTTHNTDSGLESYISAIDESGGGVDTFTVTTSGENFSADNASEYESGENVTITITADSGYYISSVSCDDNTAVITENGDGSFTVTFAISQDTTITIVTAESGTSAYLDVTTDNTNCTFAYYDENGNELSETEIPIKEYVKIVCTANSGYYFATAPRIVVYHSTATQTSYNFSIDETNPDNDYPTIYSYEIAATTSGTYIYHVSLYGYGTLTDSDFEGYGCCSFYIVTKEQLKAISDSRQRLKTLDYSYIFTDQGDYISTLACVYMDVAGSGEKETLLLGGYSTGLAVEKITNLFQKVDCGYFTVDEIFNNAYDYENALIRAYLPFYGFADLETVKYMNKTTHVYYKVFVQTGDSLIIFEDSDSNILDTFVCKIAYDIPYLVKGETYDTNATQINTNLLYGFKPFIEISYNNAVNTIDVKGYNDKYNYINDLSGYIKCEEVFNTIQTTQQERTLIDNLLKNGIII